jgi:hypothetical protein
MTISISEDKNCSSTGITEQQGNKQMPNPVNIRKMFIYLRLEPYEGKLSCTVLRRERRGNPPDPADDDAFLALKVVDSNMYQAVEDAVSHDKNYRFNGFPKDAFHVACMSHKTRIKNILRFSGIDPIEKALLKQRYVNLSAGQGGYVEKQKKALINAIIPSRIPDHF